ncbi:MAG: hypothetical protein RSC75_12670, partial [Bacteroidales bacterium]
KVMLIFKTPNFSRKILFLFFGQFQPKIKKEATSICFRFGSGISISQHLLLSTQSLSIALQK